MLIAIIVWVIFGFIAGYLAKAIMPGPDGGGFFMTALLGIVGAIVGGFIGSALFGSGTVATLNVFSQTFWISLVFAVIGALVVLAIYRMATGRSIRA